MILNWNKKIFYIKKVIRSAKKKYFIGFNLRLKYFNEGSYHLLEGMCLMMKGKKNKNLLSSVVIMKQLINDDIVYYRIPLFLSGAYLWKKISYTYRKKLFFCSRIMNRIK